ncbi:hypothetical protein FF38_04059, partial [Lucilia cuprina]
MKLIHYLFRLIYNRFDLLNLKSGTLNFVFNFFSELIKDTYSFFVEHTFCLINSCLYDDDINNSVKDSRDKTHLSLGFMMGFCVLFFVSTFSKEFLIK